MTPRVSVVVTCHDLGRYLDEAVASVLAQTFDDFEIVVVDDGSTDPDTVALLAGYARPKTRVVRMAHGGLPAAKNRGVAETTGEYVCCVDADDRLAPACLARSVAALDADPGLAFASHWVRWFGAEEADWTPAACDLAALVEKNTVNGAALVRRRVLRDAGGFDESMRAGCEDWDAWLTIVERGGRGTIIPELLYDYRRRPGSMSRMMQGELHDDIHRYLVRKHETSFRRHAPALVLARAHRTADLLRVIHDLELEYAGTLAPAAADRRAEAGTLRRAGTARAAGWALAAERDRLASDLAAARRDVEELRASLSWRVTAPLRAVWGWAVRRRSGS